MVEVATASAPHESTQPQRRPDSGAAAARTEQLFTEYGRTVRGLCHALLRDRAEAEDAAQQTFLSAHRALLNGGDPREPAAWLATIARNECWARIRTRMREPLPTAELDASATTNDPLAEALRQADLRALWAAIEELPRPQRDALLLREFGGLSYAELAAALAVTGPAVESLLFRARGRLRRKLRAAFASTSGGSWVESLVRVLVGGGPPVAAKVAALGIGVAALGSTAAVGPRAFDNHHPSHGPAAAAPEVVAQRPKPRHAPVLAVRTVAPVPSPVQVAPVRRSGEREMERTTQPRADGGDRSDGASDSGGGSRDGSGDGSGDGGSGD
jgi:RNA polymerase sigma factor (sigma-70 family)